MLGSQNAGPAGGGADSSLENRLPGLGEVPREAYTHLVSQDPAVFAVEVNVGYWQDSGIL